MKSFDIFELSNGLKVILKINKNTPRTSLNIFIDTGTKCENIPGLASMSGRMLLQGTKTRTAEELAQEIDTFAIDLNTDTKQDYTKIKALFLNEDIKKALELMSDIVCNSTFESFEKEKRKFKGEIEVDLDSPKTKAVDNFAKNIYENHPYGNSYTKILESIDKITKEEILNFYFNGLTSETAKIVIVGDVDKEEIKKLLEEYFGKIKLRQFKKTELKNATLEETKTVTITKDDASQSQVIQGWLVPGILSEDYPALTILNTILGSSGLSSRLFLELRDKQGLAYVVRSSYDSLKLGGNFSVYIATEPKNIKTALDGFKSEIKKLQDELVPQEELDSAKNNILGKRDFFHETNAQQAHYLGYYEIIGLGAGYDEVFAEKLKKVTTKDIQRVAKNYLSGASVISLLAPKKFL